MGGAGGGRAEGGWSPSGSRWPWWRAVAGASPGAWGPGRTAEGPEDGEIISCGSEKEPWTFMRMDRPRARAERRPEPGFSPGPQRSCTRGGGWLEETQALGGSSCELLGFQGWWILLSTGRRLKAGAEGEAPASRSLSLASGAAPPARGAQPTHGSGGQTGFTACPGQQEAVQAEPSQAEFPEAVEAVASGGAAGCSEAEGPASGTPLTAPVLSFPGLSRVPGREGTHTGFSFLCWKLALHFSCLLRQHGLCPHLCVLSPRRVNWGKSAWTVLTVKT